MVLLVAICLIIYFASVVGCIEITSEKDIDMNFASLMIIATPLLNTYVAIRYGDVKGTIAKLKNIDEDTTSTTKK